MEEGHGHRLPLGGDGHRLGIGRGGVMRQRLAHAEIHQPDAHARREQHRNPGQEPEVRRRVVRPQLEIPEPAGGEEDDRAEEDRHREQEKPTERRQGPALHGTEDRFGACRKEGPDCDEHSRDRDGADEHRPIDYETAHQIEAFKCGSRVALYNNTQSVSVLGKQIRCRITALQLAGKGA